MIKIENCYEISLEKQKIVGFNKKSIFNQMICINFHISIPFDAVSRWLSACLLNYSKLARFCLPELP